MTYRVRLSPHAVGDLAKLDKPIAQRLLDKTRWLAENFETESREMLAGELHGLFKLRAGHYRIIYTADQNEHVLTVHLLGHRREIYKPK